MWTCAGAFPVTLMKIYETNAEINSAPKGSHTCVPIPNVRSCLNTVPLRLRVAASFVERSGFPRGSCTFMSGSLSLAWPRSAHIPEPSESLWARHFSHLQWASAFPRGLRSSGIIWFHFLRGLMWELLKNVSSDPLCSHTSGAAPPQKVPEHATFSTQQQLHDLWVQFLCDFKSLYSIKTKLLVVKVLIYF